MPLNISIMLCLGAIGFILHSLQHCICLFMFISSIYVWLFPTFKAYAIVTTPVPPTLKNYLLRWNSCNSFSHMELSPVSIPVTPKSNPCLFMFRDHVPPHPTHACVPSFQNEILSSKSHSVNSCYMLLISCTRFSSTVRTFPSQVWLNFLSAHTSFGPCLNLSCHTGLVPRVAYKSYWSFHVPGVASCLLYGPLWVSWGRRT